MPDELLEQVERDITNNVSPERIREKFLEQGYGQEEIDKAITQVRDRQDHAKRSREEQARRALTKKEIADRIGYGFVPHQFINILFYLIGAGYFSVGVVNGAKNVISAVLSNIAQSYSDENPAKNYFISVSGYIFGFSFLGMAAAIILESPLLFACFLLLGSVGVASHGDLYDRFVKEHLSRDRMNTFLTKVGNLGVLITAASMLLSGYILEAFPWTGEQTVELFGSVYPVYGYLISFEITAFAFILSGYFVSRIDTEDTEHTEFLAEYWEKLQLHLSTFLRNKKLFLLIVTSIIAGFVQGLGNSYYGIFIYENFTNVGLGGFLNVGAVFFIAVVTSLFGPSFSRFMQETTGLAPTLVFGTLLTAMMPFILVYNPQLWAIGAAAALTVLGSSILGTSQGLLARELLHESERKVYFSAVSVAAVIPYVVLYPLGSWYAAAEGLQALFKILGFSLILLVVPIYVVLVFMSDDE